MKSTYFAVATAALVGLAACASESTSPGEFKPTSARFAVGDATNSTAELGVIKVCKTGDVGGSFDVARTAVGASTGTVSGDNTVIDTGDCTIVAADNGGDGVGSNVTISEDATVDTVSSITSCSFLAAGASETPCELDPAAPGRFLNSFHGYVVTYNNAFTPPPPPSGCTYTKGWYQNKNGAPTIDETLDGRTPDEQRAIFAASPGQPGGVTWGTNNKPNNLLNLYQQLLAALNNGGATGPQSVQDAINAALAATGGSGLNITLVGSPDIGALIAPLANFNEGLVPGFPHCSDEVLPS